MSSAQPQVRRPRTRAAVAGLALAVSAVLTVLTGCSSAPSGTTAPTAPRTPPATAVASGRAATAAPPVRHPAAPVKVAIPSIGVSAPLMGLGLQADGTLEVPPPDKGMTAGWYTGGPVPGDAGPAVIVGHNSTRYGKAVFHDLKHIAKGADITVTNARGQSAHFTVTAVESVSKKSFPTQKVYGPTTAHALRLITCDGAFDAHGHPVDNLVVYATLN
ncbi:class F sortase [Actinacidiphila paucisporea]|uniref:Sortase family protein n=1 Tax=Actinacidiphila paucisporea TaxID=310782 RepID=A0A1M7H3N0_9ACTN|nr:class F sortase [Actinacidiphila paucisporea]SHM23013.1 Sortase family protein [Actinacidiphila paucisporea]